MLSRNYLHIIGRIVLYCMLGVILALQIEAIKKTQAIEEQLLNFEDVIGINFYMDKETAAKLMELRDAHNTMGHVLKKHLKDYEEKKATGAAR